jgi:hypothetical protein
MGFVLVTGFIEILQLVTTSNYYVLSKSRALQFPTVLTKPSQFVFTNICLATDPTVDSCAHIITGW